MTLELQADVARRGIVEHTRRLAEAAADAGPESAVPTAEGWTVRDLVEHVGQTQHWVADIIERRVHDPTQLSMDMAELPADPVDWPTWLSGAAQRVTDACTDEALAAPIWNAAGDERTGGRFWMTSMLNEAVVHGADAANAAGRSLAVEPDIAAALITNHLRMLTSPTWEAQRPESARALRGTGQTLMWKATDVAGEQGGWLVHRQPQGAGWQHAGSTDADVTITGPGAAILLLLTRRAPLSGHEARGLHIDGDAGLVSHWIDSTAHIAG